MHTKPLLQAYGQVCVKIKQQSLLKTFELKYLDLVINRGMGLS